jgi:NAD(P)-dependent dehydrogenase (short-subunit alcohol dehydrogenase family)
MSTSRIFITGSSDGLGMIAATILLTQGHTVTLHARSGARATTARTRLPGAEDVLIGDVSTIAGARRIAEEANAGGRYDAVIHNVGVWYPGPRPVETADGLDQLFAVNVLAPYLLTALITPPRRLVYLSSGMHRSGDANLDDPQWKRRPWDGIQAYSNSKLFDAMLAFAVARRWPGVLSNAVDPGWVATKMGGPDAPDDLLLGGHTQAWLAAGDDAAATVTGSYFYHQHVQEPHPAARDRRLQDALLAYCASLTGVALPEIGAPRAEQTAARPT